MEKVKDKYDLAVEYLTEHPDQIRGMWGSVGVRQHACLFQFANAIGIDAPDGCGCLTQVKNGFASAATTQLTAEIRADSNIPEWPKDIRVEHLPHFASWQRRIDKELNRK